jgi:predicted DNA-binding transcriptional regulator YafY
MAKKASKGRAQGKRGAASGGRNDQLVRLLKVMHLIESRGGCDVYELSREFGKTVRTIRRDLDAIESAGIPLQRVPAEDSSRMRYAFDRDAEPRVTRLLGASHFLALKVAMTEGTVSHANGSIWASLESLADTIEDAIGEKGRAQLLEIDRAFWSWDKFALSRAPTDRVEALVEAISRHHLVEVTYRAPARGNQEKKYKVLPLRLFTYNGNLYLHAWYEKFRQVLLLNVHRLVALKPLPGQVVEPPSSYDPKGLEDSAFGIFIGPEPVQFALRFDALARPYIEERKWHPTQKLTVEKDGGVTLTFRCVDSYEVTNWVASWREHVEVLAPQKLRDELAGYGAWLQQRYAAKQ